METFDQALRRELEELCQQISGIDGDWLPEDFVAAYAKVDFIGSWMKEGWYSELVFRRCAREDLEKLKGVFEETEGIVTKIIDVVESMPGLVQKELAEELHERRRVEK